MSNEVASRPDRTARLSVRVNRGHRRIIEEAAAAEGERLSDWVRSELIRAARRARRRTACRTERSG